jgi:predicted nucleic-acid-binding Zn-ribbon protein
MISTGQHGMVESKSDGLYHKGSGIGGIIWKCTKCSCESYKSGEVRVCGGFFAKVFNLSTRKFATITCELCGFTEFYERYQNPVSNILDIIIR